MRMPVPLSLVAIVLALVVAASGCTSSDPSPAPSGSASPAKPWNPVPGQELREPEQLFPEDGVLEVTLRTELGEVDIAGSTIKAMPYNGSFTGPTLNLQPGWDPLESTCRHASLSIL